MKAGDCPSAETLLAYLAGELPSDRLAGVVAHVAQCGLCDNLMERMKAFDEPVRGSLPEGEWRVIERDLTADFERRLTKTNRAGRRSQLRAWLWRPALGYALAGILAFPATRWLLLEWVPIQARHPVATVPPSAAEWVPTLEVSPTRDRQPIANALAPSNEFVLQFYIPSRKGTRYSAEIRDSSGRTMVTVHDLVISDDRGRLSLLCRRRAFPPGGYRLIVTENGSSGESAIFFFHL